MSLNNVEGNTIIDVNTKSLEEIEIANLINDDEMSDSSDVLFKA